MSWSVDVMALPIKPHLMSPVTDGTNSLVGSAPHPRSISATLSPSSLLSLSRSPQLSALPSTSYHCTSSVSPSQPCPPSRSGSHLPPGCLQLPMACPSHLLKLFILGSRHCYYCLLIFQMLFWSYSAENFSVFQLKKIKKFPLLLVYLLYRGLDSTRILSDKYIIYFDNVSPTPTSWRPYPS